MPSNLGDLSGLIKQAHKIQADLARVQAELAEKTVEATAGGGMVTARVNGRQELVAIRIDPKVVDPGEVEMLEDLVLAAVAQAMKKSQEMAQQALGELTGGLGLPGLTP